MRLVSGALRTESFYKNVKVVYGPGWESTVPGQCLSLERCREDMTLNRVVVGVEVLLC